MAIKLQLVHALLLQLWNDHAGDGGQYCGAGYVSLHGMFNSTKMTMFTGVMIGTGCARTITQRWTLDQRMATRSPIRVVLNSLV
jgi:hypothetical protein